MYYLNSTVGFDIPIIAEIIKKKICKCAYAMRVFLRKVYNDTVYSISANGNILPSLMPLYYDGLILSI